MIWAFIDYENIGSLEKIDFKKYSRLFIFCGPKNTKINIGSPAISEFIQIEIIKTKTIGSNNLDFHIAYYLGQFSNTAPQEAVFHVISNDTGFNELVCHIQKTGRQCSKVSLETKKKVQKKAEKTEKAVEPKLSSCAKLAVERLEHIDGRKRPRKESKLVNWIESQCKSISKNIDAPKILVELIKFDLIEKDGTTIKYKLNC